MKSEFPRHNNPSLFGEIGNKNKTNNNNNNESQRSHHTDKSLIINDNIKIDKRGGPSALSLEKGFKSEIPRDRNRLSLGESLPVDINNNNFNS